MNASVFLALANIQRPRRGDPGPRAPFVDVRRARQALAEDGVAVGHLHPTDLSALARLGGAVSELADCLAVQRRPAGDAVDVINELASGCTGRLQLQVSGQTVERSMAWDGGDPVARLTGRVIDEVASIDPSRLRQCQRQECDLLFLDTTRSRSQRWHAENPCGWLERQHRRRAT